MFSKICFKETERERGGKSLFGQPLSVSRFLCNNQGFYYYKLWITPSFHLKFFAVRRLSKAFLLVNKRKRPTGILHGALLRRKVKIKHKEWNYCNAGKWKSYKFPSICLVNNAPTFFLLHSSVCTQLSTQFVHTSTYIPYTKFTLRYSGNRLAN